MIVHGEPFLPVVEQERFGRTERRELDLGLVETRFGKEPRDARRARAKERLATAPNERLESARFGERRELVGAKPRPAPKIVEVVERPFGAKRFDGERRLFGKSLHQAKSEAKRRVSRSAVSCRARFAARHFERRVPKAPGHVDVRPP